MRPTFRFLATGLVFASVLSACQTGPGGSSGADMDGTPASRLEAGNDAALNEVLVEAARRGRLDLMQFVLKKGANSGFQGSISGETPLTAAISSGNAETVALLLGEDAAPDMRNAGGWTPLLTAVAGNQAEILAMLLDAGADHTLRDPVQGLTPTLLAALLGHTSCLVKLLENRDKAVDLDSVDPEQGDTLLTLASENRGSLDLIGELLARGANPDQTADDGWTPLMVAANAGNPGAVELLLAESANPDLQNPEGLTALIIAADRERIDIMELLLRAEANVHLRGNGGETPAGRAALGGNPEALQMLLDAGADVNQPGRDDFPLLVQAVRSGSLPAVRLLLERGANVDAVTRDLGHSALMFAANSNQPDIVDLLLKEGANVLLEGKDGWTASEAAGLAGADALGRKLKQAERKARKGV